MNEPLIVREADVDQERWSDPVRGQVAFRTLLGGGGASTGFTAGVTDLGPGGWLGHHRHEPPEIYYVLAGAGVLTIDGEEHPVRAGTAAYIPGNSEHAIRNAGDSGLRFFYAFAVDSFDEIDYRFSAQG